jgi:Ca2+-binding RTX toxin-like protein
MNLFSPRTIGSLIIAAAFSASFASSASAQAASVSASFDGSVGVLKIVGTDGNDSIALSRGDGGIILINGGAVAISGGRPSINNTTSITIGGLAGDDHIILDEASGLPSALLDGGDGNDTIEVNGANFNEVFAASANSGIVRLERVSPAPYTLDITSTENLLVNANAGNDTFNGGNGLAPLIKLTVDGGPGNDILNGGDGADTLIGGDGNDTIDGNRGNDLGLMGAGDDVFIWDPGDGSDTVEGQDGRDTMLFNGAAGAEIFDVSANGGRVRFFRNLGNIVMDLDDVEQIDLNALGGIDTTTVNDLSGTDMALVNVNLAGAVDSTAGDGAVDSVIVNATAGNDTVEISGSRTANVVGLAANVSVFNVDPASDTLTVNMLGGNDTADASPMGPNVVKLTLDGGAGNDTLVGSKGGDVLLGGDDNDTLVGFLGEDQVFGQAGDDRMIWSRADGTDLNEGGDGSDTVEVNGLDINEVFSAAPNGDRVRFERTTPATAPFSIDIGTSENLVLNANGGNDVFNGSNGLAPLIKLTVDGGPGNDTLNGGDGVDVLIGGDGNDTIDGNRGNDVGLMGAGDDVFIWDPGDGSDTVEGQDGHDTMLFNGAAGSEIFDASANGGRVRFFRNLGNIVMDLDDVEQITLNALGGIDTTTVNDLTGTDMADVVINLAGSIGSTAGDGAADAVIVNGTNGADNVSIARTNGNQVVSGLAATVTIGASEGANDTLLVNGLDGNDTLDAHGLPAGRLTLTLDGGNGDDTLIGSAGVDVGLNGEVLVDIP